jgi:hypothetical protein
MTNNDPLAPWRNAAEFTLEEAASLIVGFAPGRGFPIPRDRTEKDRDLLAQYGAWLSLLRAAADELGVSKRAAPASDNGRSVRDPGFARNW